MNSGLASRYQEFMTRSLAATLSRQKHWDLNAHWAHVAKSAWDTVPAYREFCGGSVSSSAEFTLVDLPVTSKQNYMRAYPLPDRCRGGNMDAGEMLAVSSGSTGEPLFWPRNLADELEIAGRFEHILHWGFHCDERPTLAVICFALGNWVGGLYTANCCRLLAQKGLRLTVATPGNNVNEIFRVIESLGCHFAQIVLFGYPPFVKNIIDEGCARKIPWQRHNLKLVFAGEVFSEEWRNLVCQRGGIADPVRDTASLYGTADAGVLGNETPLSVAIRRYLATVPSLAREIFGESRLPTLVQYDPASRYLELCDGTLTITADTVLPLVRYNIGDRGGILSFSELWSQLENRGASPGTRFARFLPPEPVNLPFVYVFGRADFTISFFGANIYPENISSALDEPEIATVTTGKFVMWIDESAPSFPVVNIAVELLANRPVTAGLETMIAERVRSKLVSVNSEFGSYVPPQNQLPKILFRPQGDPQLFPPGIKHRYSLRQPP